jgi:2-C-methyl-D-erythritol 2,4-cyclodiphosphate synthase/2-C-methyl-D-erythritol 4-phosphate cytidylyltransferase
MPPFFALVPAAGYGRRFGASRPKQFLLLHGRPLLAWTLDALAKAEPRQIVLALPPDALEQGRDLLASCPQSQAEVVVVSGGKHRQESVRLCLEACGAGADDLVLVHDGARPLVALEDVEETLIRAATSDGAVLGRRVTDTLKRVAAGELQSEADRRGLFRAETPQVFRRRVLEAAYARVGEHGSGATDEAGLVALLEGLSIVAVEATRPNPKITAPGDLVLAEALLGAARSEREGQMASEKRVGHGYDIHAKRPGRPLILGGVRIRDEDGLEGFSDADVVFHAVGDALLGAVALGDLGHHFPPGDERWRDADSSRLLTRIVEMTHECGWKVENCDVTVVAEEPKLAPFRAAMIRNLARLLDVEGTVVSVKATTHEGLGALGRGEGISATAVVLLARGHGDEEGG